MSDIKDDHQHPPAAMVDEVSEFEILELAVRELAIEKGLFTQEDHNQWTEYMHTLGPAPAARLVAKAWLDPEYKELAVKDGVKASLDVGIDWVNSMPTHFGTPSDYCNLRVMEDTPTLKHVVVCTLCSCYPRNLLGLPPDWYKSRAYRSRTVKEPRKVLAEFGVTLPTTTTVRVHDSTADMRYVVIPQRPSGTDDWTAEALQDLVTRDSMIGTGQAKLPNAR